MSENAPVTYLSVSRKKAGWHSVVREHHLEVGLHPLVAVIQRDDSSVIFDEWGETRVWLDEILEGVLRAQDRLPLGQFDRFELIELEPAGHTGRWALSLFATYHRELVVTLTLLNDLGRDFLADLDVAYCENHMHEDRDEVEMGLACCMSRGGAVIAGLTEGELELLESEELELREWLVTGAPDPRLE
jgi:hypothetical protein